MGEDMSPIKQFTNLQAIIDFAIEKEEESADFYRDLLKKVKLRKVIDEIQKLINVEVGHKNMLKSLNVKAFAAKIITPNVDLRISEYIAEVEPDPSMSLKDLFNIAMHREQKAAELYRQIAKFFDGEEKQLFENLASEETDHKHFFETKWDWESVRTS
jgi:rubrerythrin